MYCVYLCIFAGSTTGSCFTGEGLECESQRFDDFLAPHLSKAPKGNGIGATGSKNWVWF